MIVLQKNVTPAHPRSRTGYRPRFFFADLYFSLTPLLRLSYNLSERKRQANRNTPWVISAHHQPVIPFSLPFLIVVRPLALPRLARGSEATIVGVRTRMKRSVIITCAVTGGDDTASRFPNVPVSPKQIADAALDASDAGASIVHLHVRDPQTGRPSMETVLYREVVERIRERNDRVIINLTTGPGARFVPSDNAANAAQPESNLRPPQDRVRHITEIAPEVCSLDMGSLNFGKGALINVPRHIEIILAAIRSAGVKPELEIFDTGHLALALHMIGRGLIGPPPLFQIVLGVPWGAPATPEMLVAMKSLLPRDAQWAAFGISRWEFPMVAQSVLLGGHVRVGLEDNLYLEKGILAPSNAALVEKARRIIDLLGASVATVAEARQMLGLNERATSSRIGRAAQNAHPK